MNLRDTDLVNRKIVYAVAQVAALSILIASLASAQSPSPFAVETNIKGVYAYTEPPAGFNPMTASAAELELYGYPPRPAANAPAKALATWEMIANPALKRIVPELSATSIYHRPVENLVIKNSKKAASSNWSGYALVHKRPQFTSVTGAWLVPIVQQAFGTCGGTDYSSDWAGIDGFANNSLFQSGSESDATCVSDTTTTENYPWIEWLPGATFEITASDSSALPFAPGDYLIVVVTATNWSGGESTSGTLSYTDVTQNWQVDGTITAAALDGSPLVGQSTEWIIERPEVGGSTADLANYVAVPWFEASATDVKNKTYFPGSPAGATAYSITMLDDSNSPISFADLFNPDTLLFLDEGSAL